MISILYIVSIFGISILHMDVLFIQKDKTVSISQKKTSIEIKKIESSQKLEKSGPKVLDYSNDEGMGYNKFQGYDCTGDCSGHEAGYNWAEDKGISNSDDCGGNSNSFIEGCEEYVEDEYDGCNEGGDCENLDSYDDCDSSTYCSDNLQ